MIGTVADALEEICLLPLNMTWEGLSPVAAKDSLGSANMTLFGLDDSSNILAGSIT